MIVVGIVSLCINGLNLGIDFKGGTSITINTEDKISLKDVKEDVKGLNYNLVEAERVNDNVISLKVEETLEKEDINNVDNYFASKYKASTDIGVVSNVVKKELIKNAIISLIFAALGIIIYVSFRFTFSYAVTGLIALLHDVFFIFALFCILKLEVSSIFVAAVLSIIGYSINDTIVTFDRIKENINKNKNKIKDKTELAEIVNKSLRDTLGRSIITTITTLIPVICLIVLGAYEILNFNIALLFGLISGVYSSIFLASQLWFDIEKRNIKTKYDGKKKEKKEIEEYNVKGINS
jgi:SecD/SecF fusion protein